MSIPNTVTTRCLTAILAALALTSGTARAQSLSAASDEGVFATSLRHAAIAPSLVAPAVQSSSFGSGDRDDWKVAIYPVFVWLPFSIGLDVTVPPGGDSGDGAGDGGRAEIIDGRFDGAYFGGFYASKERFRIDADGLWAGFGGDRPELPFLRVDVDAIYFHTTAGVRLVKDLYAVAGVRRVALKYDITFAGLSNFERKPGIWDPVVGLAWHTDGARVLELHAVVEGGGFGVGSEEELAASVRLDLKPFEHFGLSAGYSLLYLKLEDTVASRTFSVTQTLHGPTVGIGFYF